MSCSVYLRSFREVFAVHFFVVDGVGAVVFGAVVVVVGVGVVSDSSSSEADAAEDAVAGVTVGVSVASDAEPEADATTEPADPPSSGAQLM